MKKNLKEMGTKVGSADYAFDVIFDVIKYFGTDELKNQVGRNYQEFKQILQNKSDEELQGFLKNIDDNVNYGVDRQKLSTTPIWKQLQNSLNASNISPITEEEEVVEKKSPSIKQFNKTLSTFLSDLVTLKTKEKHTSADFLSNLKKLVNVVKTMNNIDLSSIEDMSIKKIVNTIKKNKIHGMIQSIRQELSKKDVDANKFMEIYLNIASKVNTKSVENLNEGVDLTDKKFLSVFKSNFKTYLKDLIGLFSKMNKKQNLDETKKKNKYSKKASEFIGKEISHLKKDKGYPQDRAVAAAINVAKKKGMKVGAKKKSPKNKN